MDYKTAANRLHHLSMRYLGAFFELFQGKKIGLLPQGLPGTGEVRDLIDLILITRTEINGVTNLLCKKGITTKEEIEEEMSEQYQWLTGVKEKQLGITVSDHGLVFETKKKE